MTSSFSELLEHAYQLERLCSDTEPGLRTVASRRYYAAYHRARAAAQGLPDPPEGTRGSHERVIRQYQDVPAGFPDRTRIRQIGGYLREARDARHDADYELGRNFSSEHLEELKSYCEEIERLLAETGLG